MAYSYGTAMIALMAFLDSPASPDSSMRPSEVAGQSFV